MLQRLMSQHLTKWGDGTKTCRLGCCHPASAAWSTQVLISCVTEVEKSTLHATSGCASGSSAGSSAGATCSSAPASPVAGGPQQGGGRGRGKGSKCGNKQQGPKPAAAAASGHGAQVHGGSSQQQLMSVSDALSQLFRSKHWLFVRLCVWVQRAEERSALQSGDKVLLQQHALSLAEQLLADPPSDRLHDRPGMSQLLSPLESVQHAAC